MYRIIFFIGLFLFCCLSPVPASMYTWTDENGVRHFSNIAPPRESDALFVDETSEWGGTPLGGQAFRVIRVYDGDTILVQGLDIRFKIRLVGIDAPETGGRDREGQPFSRKASQFLETLVQDQSVTLKSYGIGGFNRVLAEVFLGNINVNLELVKNGLAEVYQGTLPKELNAAPYRSAEILARDGAKGVWQLGDRYVSPRKWRKENYKR